MKKNYIKNLLLIGTLVLITISNQAQNYVHQVIIVNEGHYDYLNSIQVTPVTVAAYNPVNKNYVVFDTIQDARFASDVKVDANYIFVAADSFLIAYDKNSYQVVNTKIIPGIRKIAEWNNQILISRGNLVDYSSYYQVYDKSTFNKIYELDTAAGPKFSTQGIAVIHDTAYIAINNGFAWGSYVGKLGFIDLNSQSYKGEIDLGADGLNPDNIMSDGNKVYTLNNKDWSGSSVSSFDPYSQSIQTTNLSVSTGCGTSVRASSYIYYQESGSDKVARFNVNSQTTADSLPITKSFYGLLTDSINNLIYGTSTDYVSYGKAYIMDYNGLMADSFNVGVSPGNMALDIRNLLSVREKEETIVNIYPNPAAGIVNVSSTQPVKVISLELSDVTGRVVYKKSEFNLNNNFQLDLSAYKSGIYFLKINRPDGESNSKLIKN